MSKHAEGLAFDIKPVQNPFIKFDKSLNEMWRTPKDSLYNEESPGTLNSLHPLVIHMKSLGWEWGGDWTKDSGRIDYQHF